MALDYLTVEAGTDPNDMEALGQEDEQTILEALSQGFGPAAPPPDPTGGNLLGALAAAGIDPTVLVARADKAKKGADKTGMTLAQALARKAQMDDALFGSIGQSTRAVPSAWGPILQKKSPLERLLPVAMSAIQGYKTRGAQAAKDAADAELTAARQEFSKAGVSPEDIENQRRFGLSGMAAPDVLGPQSDVLLKDAQGRYLLRSRAEEMRARNEAAARLRAEREARGAADAERKAREAEEKAKKEGASDRFDQELKLRNQWMGTSTYKNAQLMADAYAKINTTSGTGPGDLSLVFAFMKLIDPASTVREGEQAQAQNAGGVPASIRGIWNNALGEGRLTPELRSEFKKEARKLRDAAFGRYKTEGRLFGKMAEESYGLSAKNVVIPLSDFDADAAPQAAPTAGASMAPTTPGAPPVASEPDPEDRETRLRARADELRRAGKTREEAAAILRAEGF